MCGIFGIVTQEERELGNILIEAGQRLSYRGYDSVGVATLGPPGAHHGIDLRKDVGKVEAVAGRLNFQEMQGTRGILQLRWATFGDPSQANAQPHLDSSGGMVGAHNGNVVNNYELRRQFIAEGMLVRSENDGETCVHAVERYLRVNPDMLSAIRAAYYDLAGDYAFVVGRVNENCLYAIKKGSGLVAGIGDGFTVLSSDLPSLLPLTRRIIRINDGEMITLYPDHIEIHRVTDGQVIERGEEYATESMEVAQKGGYPHFMLKEIHEQPVVARELLHLLDHLSNVNTFLERMSGARHLYLVGCGTSYHACILGAIYLARLAGRPAIPVLAPQFIAQYGPALTAQDVGIFVSQSGETKDVLNAVEAAQAKGAGVLGLVNVIGSSLMRISESHVPLACGYEISVPATKTFSNQVLAFLFLATRLANRPTDRLAHIPGLMEQTIQMATAQIETLAASLAPRNDLYCLGYGLTYPIALEGALKLKEVTYAHCEGMLSTEFKHGPLSAVDQDYPVIFVAGSENIPLIVSGINEVTCRGGRVIAIGEEDTRLHAHAHGILTLPISQPEVSALLATIPLQMLSYRLSLARGYDPDFPRNLSKTLTVD